jgi:hypothetical protein
MVMSIMQHFVIVSSTPRAVTCLLLCASSLRETLASPSAKCTRGRGKNTRGSLPWVHHSGKSLRGCLSRGRGLPRVPKIVHLGKPSPSAVLALGEDLTPSVLSVFFGKPLPRVQHSGKKFFIHLILFPECNTWGRIFFFLNPLTWVPHPKHSGKK